MSDFFENRNFLGLKGIIGRRDFIINCLIIETIEYVISSVIMYAVLFHNPHNFVQFRSVSTIPQWYYLMTAIIGAISSVFYFSNIMRRVRDIKEVEDVRIITSVLTLVNFVCYLPIVPASFKWISPLILICLAATKGKVTSQKPVDPIIKFNWGAFIGTWMWGIFNKTPITLLMLLFFLTPAAFPFMLICGLKGNEWAYKNKKYDSIEKFHTSQSNHSIFWLIFTPIILFIFFVVSVFIGGAAFFAYSKSNSDGITKLENITSKMESFSAEMTFDNIDLKEDEYNFYISPETWNTFVNSSKPAIFKMAVSYAEAKNKIDLKPDKSEGIYGSVLLNREIANKTKIYSTFNNEILAEFSMDSKQREDLIKDLKESKITFYDAQYKGIKLNNNPTLP